MLLYAMQTLPSITSLDLTACDLLNDGAACVAAALGGELRGAPALATLSLRANRIGATGAAAIGAGVARCGSLAKLDLSANPIGDDGLIRLACGDPPELTEGTGAFGETVVTAAELLSRAVRDSEAAMGGAGDAPGDDAATRRRRNRRAQGGEAGLCGLQHSQSLTSILLSKVGLGARSVPAIAALVSSLDLLTEIDLSVNAFAGVDEWGVPKVFDSDAQPDGGGAGGSGGVAAGSAAGSSGFGRLGRRGGRGAAAEPTAAALSAAFSEALDDLAVDAAMRASGSNNANDWDFPSSMRTLGRVLGSRPQLTKLAIQHCAARARVGACVASCVHATTCVAPIAHLNLQGSSLSEAAFSELCKALKDRAGAGPTNLNLEGCVRNAHGALPALWALLKASETPCKVLNIGFNGLRQGAELGAALAANHGALTELDAGSNELGGEHVEAGVVALCKSFSAAPLVKSGKGGDAKGGEAKPSRNGGDGDGDGGGAGGGAGGGGAGEHQQRGHSPVGVCTLHSLDLSYTRLGLSGAKSLAGVLTLRGCALTSLRLDGCSLGADGVAALSAALGESAKCAPIKTLRLEYNGMGVEGTKHLAVAMPSRPTLTALFIGCNALSSAGARHLASAISVSPNLQTLDCGDNDLDEQAMRSLLEGVRSQYSITALDVSNNR